MTESLTIDQLRTHLLYEMDQVDEIKLFYTLKKMKIKKIGDLNTYKACIVLSEANLPITSNSVAWLLGLNTAQALTRLHRLGDHFFLILDKQKEEKELNKYEWKLHPYFKSIFYGDRR